MPDLNYKSNNNNPSALRPAWVDSDTVGEPTPAHVPKQLFPLMPATKLANAETDTAFPDYAVPRSSWHTISQQIQQQSKEREKREKAAAEKQAAAARKERAEVAPVPQCSPTSNSFADFAAANDSDSEITTMQPVLRPEFPPTPFVPKELDAALQSRAKLALPLKPEPRPELTPPPLLSLNPEPLPKKVLELDDPQEKLRFFAETRRHERKKQAQKNRGATQFITFGNTSNENAPRLRFGFRKLTEADKLELLSKEQANKILADTPSLSQSPIYTLNKDLYEKGVLQLAKVNDKIQFVTQEENVSEILHNLETHYSGSETAAQTIPHFPLHMNKEEEKDEDEDEDEKKFKSKGWVPR